MNVDDLVIEGFAEGVRYDLHVASKNDEINLVFALHQFNFFGLLFNFGRLGDCKYFKGNVEGISNRFEIRVVADNESDFAVQLSSSMSEQKLPQAVVVFRDHDADFLFCVSPVELVIHFESLANFVDALFQSHAIRVHHAIVKLDPLEEEIERHDLSTVLIQRCHNRVRREAERRQRRCLANRDRECEGWQAQVSRRLR